MADNVAITAGSGTTISTEEVTTLNAGTVAAQHIQRMLPAFRTADGTAVDYPGEGTNGLDVDVTRADGLMRFSASADATMQNAVSATGNGSNLTVTGYGTALLLVTGTFTATIDFETSMDAGTTWAGVSATKLGTTQVSAQTTTTGLYRITCTGSDLLRARVTWTSGTSVTVVGRATNAANATKLVAISTNSIAKAEDVASADADVGVPAMAVRKATPANTSGTDGDYEMLQMSAGRLWVDASGVSLTVASHAVTNAGTFAVQESGAHILADDAAFTPATSKVAMAGGYVVAHGSNPDAADAGDAGAVLMNRHRMPFVIGGHPNVQTVSARITGSNTDVEIIAGTIAPGTKVVVTRISVNVSNACSVNVGCRIGFAAATLAADSTTAATQILIDNDAFPPGGGVNVGDGSGILGIGADGEEIRITNDAPTSGTLHVSVSYYTIES